MIKSSVFEKNFLKKIVEIIEIHTFVGLSEKKKLQAKKEKNIMYGNIIRGEKFPDSLWSRIPYKICITCTMTHLNIMQLNEKIVFAMFPSSSFILNKTAIKMLMKTYTAPIHSK